MAPPYATRPDIGAKPVAQQKVLFGAVVFNLRGGAAVVSRRCTALAGEHRTTSVPAMSAIALAAAMPFNSRHPRASRIGSSPPEAIHHLGNQSGKHTVQSIRGAPGQPTLQFQLR
jgi:hypothetical protein